MTAFSLGFTPHVQRKTCTDLFFRPHPIDTLLHFAIAPVAPLHRVRGRRQSRVVKKRERFLQRGGKELLECVAQCLEPLYTPPQGGEFGEGGLGPTASIKQRGDLVHDRTQLLSLGQPTADTPQELPFGCVQVTLDTQIPMGEQRSTLPGEPLFRTGCRLCGLRARPASGQCGLRGCQALAGAGHGA